MNSDQAATTVALKSGKKTVEEKVKTVSEQSALQLMWLHYSANKAQLVSDIRESREYILSQLMLGVEVEQVFAVFLLPPKRSKT